MATDVYIYIYILILLGIRVSRVAARTQKNENTGAATEIDQVARPMEEAK